MLSSSVGSYEAKTHLPQLLERVSKGEQITITKHGVPIALLIPAGQLKQMDAQTAVEEMKKFRKGRSLSGLNIRDLIEEGRRF
jgi:prevent-host-death family protein